MLVSWLYFCLEVFWPAVFCGDDIMPCLLALLFQKTLSQLGLEESRPHASENLTIIDEVNRQLPHAR